MDRQRQNRMKSPVQSIKAELLQATQDAREALASALFEPTAVKARLLATAAKGFTSYTFTVTDPIDLRATTAAAKILAWVEKGGLHWEWQERLLANREGGGASSVYELVIRWDEGRLQAQPVLS